MKKLLLPLLVGGAFAANAQNIIIPNTHKTFVQKYTADWCPPCGAAAWTWTETLINDAKAGTLNAVVVATHNSNSNQTALNISSAYSPLRTNLDSAVTGIPSFAVGKINMAQSNSNTVKAKVNSLTASPAEVNAGFMPKWAADGKSVTIDVKTKFFTAATGTYSVGVYMYEDMVQAKQYSQGTGTYPNSTAVAHHHILRTNPLTGSGASTGMVTAFGKELTGTSFAANATFDNTVTLNLATGWNRANITFFTVVWKKVGSQWEVVNASEAVTFPTSVNDMPSDIVSGVYPNPIVDNFVVALNGNAKNCVISLVDMGGRKVAELYNGEIAVNTAAIQMTRPAGLPAGIYMLNIASDNGIQVKKVMLQ